MDRRTVQYYDDNADAVFAQYLSGRSGVEKYFRLAFPPGSEILDVGAGSGRDMGILIREEYEAYGAEPSSRLRALATAHNPALDGRIHAGALPDLAAHIDRKFDGVLCAAVFQHIAQEEQFDAAFDIRNLLKPNGRLLLSFPKERPGIDTSGRDDRGRPFTPLVAEALELLFERLGFQRLGKWEDPDSLKRPGITWTTILFALLQGQLANASAIRKGSVPRDFLWVPSRQGGEVFDSGKRICLGDKAAAQFGQAQPLIPRITRVRLEGVVEVEPIDKKADFGHKKENPVSRGNWGQRVGDRQALG